jgi:hypothetical protein
MAAGKYSWITWFAFGLLVCVPAGLVADNMQETAIQGIVLDKQTGSPLSSVHVYLSQTTIGTVTDEYGEFELVLGLEEGGAVVFSFIGYQTVIENVDPEGVPASSYFEIEMEPDIVKLQQVEVVASNREWRRDYAEFKSHFLGTNEYAREAVIENSWVLDFERDENDYLKARASEPVIVLNHALGYKVHIDLIEFSWDLSGGSGIYTFYSRFEEMEADGRRQERQWNRNRERVYRGSLRHFLISLYHDRLSANRFETVQPGSTDRIPIRQPDEQALHRHFISNSIIGLRGSTRWKGYILQQPVDVLYGRGGRYHDSRSRSRLVPQSRSGIILVSANGKLYDPKSVRVDGEWVSDRVANMLPDDLVFK